MTFVLVQSYMNKLGFRDCGKPGKTITFESATMSPMPVIHPGHITGSYKFSTNKPLIGKTLLDVSIIRQYGSCIYNDFCTFINRVFNLTPENCPKPMKDHGVDCRCPYNIPTAGTIDSGTWVRDIKAVNNNFKWFAQGDYNVTARALNAQHREIGCLNLMFSMKKR
ncbi:hypothetical protein SNEBB_008794 [Seison nebaliae]|nr:hypothetical protein SNEBB_008794 [Seison nebaliae]